MITSNDKSEIRITKKREDGCEGIERRLYYYIIKIGIGIGIGIGIENYGEECECEQHPTNHSTKRSHELVKRSE